MKKIRKYKISYRLITILALFFIVLNINVRTNAAEVKSKNVELIILFNDNSIDKDVEDIISESGGKVLNEFLDLGSVEVQCKAELIPKIKEKTSVKSLSLNHIIKMESEKKIKPAQFKNHSHGITDNLDDKYQWDVKRVTNNGKSYDLESGNHNIVVGIIDSGIDVDHPDLADNFLGGENLVPKGFNNNDSETGDPNDIDDRLGHGTEIAGIIAGNGKIKGVAPNIGFKSYRILDENGDTNATIISSAIIKATDDGVKVINLSIGGFKLKGKSYWTDPKTGIKYDMGNGTAEYSLYKRAIEYAIKNGVTVVSAAGNDGLDCSNKKKLTDYLNKKNGKYGFKYSGITYEVPGSIKGIINVSATSKDDKIAPYSNYGKDFIDISAPGGDLLDMSEDDIELSQENMCFTTTLEGDYIFVNGTSIAAPKVSAIAALIICKNKYITPKLVKRKICRTADSLGVDSSSKYYGQGLANAYNALNN
ncbi:S8 family peptidase [Clostridium taeniosporum]|uniref:Peptidase S8 n=1 Tax=Clostridium taeniosporum TaxID=394958 RepID=A0A1D7XPC6_9CLOT|nr:S8 family serine peptidase [Clostridium taeniosporum]AOR25029.1 peptidase S8 [Clostridium taeniosporum]